MQIRYSGQHFFVALLAVYRIIIFVGFVIPSTVIYKNKNHKDTNYKNKNFDIKFSTLFAVLFVLHNVTDVTVVVQEVTSESFVSGKTCPQTPVAITLLSAPVFID